MKRKKLKLKNWVWKALIIIILGIIGIFAIIKIGISITTNIKNEREYKNSYEYKLISHGYTEEDAKKLIETFKNGNELDAILNEDKDDTIIDLINEKYFLKINFQAYREYKKEKKNLSLSEVVRDINIHLDQDFYSLNLKTDPSQDYLMLVNKYYLLDNSYDPADLVSISQKYAWGDVGSKKIRKVAYDAFLDMWNAAYQDGYYLMVNSAYRTYEDQETIYNNYKENRGQKYADSIAARPGSSEHQTGLSLDIFSKNNSNQSTFENTPEALWLKENSYKYGFILRYPKDKVDITGYNYEAWHYRYVGIEAATICFENNLTYEEYYAYYIENK